MRDAFALDGGPYHFFDRSSRSAAASTSARPKASSVWRSRPRAASAVWPSENIHAAVLGLPVVSVASDTPCLRARSPVFNPGLVLLQHPDDLIFREPCSLHLSVLQEAGLQIPVEEISVAGQLLADIPTIVYSSGSGKSNTGLLRRNSTVSGSPLIATAVRTNIFIGSLMAAVEATNDSMYLHGGTNCQLDNWQSCGCKRLALS